jgi:5-methylthioadenosine/S-adenosylhomocysteine deaminase
VRHVGHVAALGLLGDGVLALLLGAHEQHGAAALGLDARIGSIEPGKQADLVAVDLRAPELSPVYDPVSQLIYACGREHVSDVWVAGKAVVRTRQLADPGVRAILHDVVGRTGVWQNRVGEILSGQV